MGFFHSAFYFAGRRRGTHTTSISMHRTHADFLSISVGRIVSETAAKTKKNQRTNGYSWESIECICPRVALFYFSTHARTRLDGYFSATPWLIRFLLVRLCFFFGSCVRLRCALRTLPLSRLSFRFASFFSALTAWSLVCSLYHKANPLYTDYVHNLYLHWYISILHNILYSVCCGARRCMRG